MIDRISSRTNPRVKAASEIARKPSSASFVIEGFHLVEMAKEAGLIDEIFATEDAKAEGQNIHIVTRDIIDKIAVSKSPEPILAIAHKPEAVEPLGPRVLVLDRVQDPGNVGTLLRTALSFGFNDVVFLPGTCSPFNAKAIASSQGAIFPLRLRFPKSETAFVEEMKALGYRIIGSALQGAKPLETYQSVNKELCLIVGNEGRGMSPFLLKSSDDLLKISMCGIDSLNVGVAGGILMHHFYIPKN